MLLRFAKLIAITILSLVLLIVGVVWLIEGISDRKVIPILAGGLALGSLVVGFFYITARSSRQVKAAVAKSDEKLRAGIRTCPRCVTDFTEATAPKTPKPWHHTAIGVALSLIPIAIGALVLWVYGFSSSQSFKAFFMLALGVGFLLQVILTVNHLQVRCPACNRVCGTIGPGAARGFPVEPIAESEKKTSG